MQHQDQIHSEGCSLLNEQSLKSNLMGTISLVKKRNNTGPLRTYRKCRDTDAIVLQKQLQSKHGLVYIYTSEFQRVIITFVSYKKINTATLELCRQLFSGFLELY